MKSNINTACSNKYTAGHSAGYSSGVTDADNRVNTGSTNYKTGYSNGVTYADGRANPDSTNYKTGYNSGYTAGAASVKVLKPINSYTKINAIYAGKVILFSQTMYDCEEVASFFINFNLAKKAGQDDAGRYLKIYGSNDASSWNLLLSISSTGNNYGVDVLAYKYVLIAEELSDATDTSNWGITWENTYTIHSIT